MGSTAKGLPYPEVTDRVADGATAIKNLANALDPAISDTGAWAAWTPTYGSFTLGNGTHTAAIKRLSDKLYAVRFRLTLGSTSVVSGGIQVNGLPITTANADQSSYGWISKADGSQRYPVAGQVPSSTAQLANRIYTPAGGAGQTATSPWTWGAGDIIVLQAILEAA